MIVRKMRVMINIRYSLAVKVVVWLDAVACPDDSTATR